MVVLPSYLVRGESHVVGVLTGYKLQLPVIVNHSSCLFDVHCISFPEQYCFQRPPYFLVAPGFTHYVSWIRLSTNVSQLDCSCCHCFPNSMVRQDYVSFIEPRGRDSRAVDNSLIVTQHIGWAQNWDSEISKSISEINYLFRGLSCCHKLRTVCGSFNHRLLL